MKIKNFAFEDATGKPSLLYDLKGKKAVVFVFLSFECPMSTNYIQALTDLVRGYADRGVAFVGICTNDEDGDWVAEKAKEYKVGFPVFRQGKSGAAEAFEAEVTPEAFVLDERFFLRYRGRIDNGYVARLKKNPRTTRHDLREALDEQLASKAVSQPATMAYGCAIRHKIVARVRDGKVTYHKHVRPILQAHCQICHRPGEVGPFSLLTYKQAVNWANDIKEFTQSRKMPPWKPVDGPGFHGERRLTDGEVAALAAWVDGGTPEGDPKDAPPARKFAEGWQLGKPDLVLTVAEDFQLGPSGRDHFRVFTLPTKLTEDRYLSAVEFRPGNPRVVHHAVLLLGTTGRARQLENKEKERPLKDDEQDRGPGYSSPMPLELLGNVVSGPWPMLGVWAPGQLPRHVPKGLGYHLPKGSDIVMQIHYSRTGRVEKDRTSVGLYFTPKPAQKKIEGVMAPGFFLSIPAGEDRYQVKGRVWISQDCTLYSVFPHMHLIGREMKITMSPPDAKARTLIHIKDWDFNWQETYYFKEPIRARAGTRFDVEAFYDNSAKNPYNPNSPPKTLYRGLQTTNEMCAVLMEATSDNPGRIWPLPFAPSKKSLLSPLNR